MTYVHPHQEHSAIQSSQAIWSFINSSTYECIGFLKNDFSANIHLEIADQRIFQSEITQIEYMMNSLCAGGLNGAGEFKVVLAERADLNRTIFRGSEKIGDFTLAQSLQSSLAREFSNNDIIFVAAQEDFEISQNLGFEDILHLSIHNIACLIAATAPISSRDTLYLCICLLMVHSLENSLPFTKILIDDFLRSWVRNVLNSKGDPLPWDENSLEKVDNTSKIHGIFMQGLKEAIQNSNFLSFPTDIQQIFLKAKEIQDFAILGNLSFDKIN